jgi:LPS export ABC transporter protein LptC
MITVVAALALIAAGNACSRKAKAPAVAKLALPDSADQVIFGLKSVMSDRGVAKGLLLADTAYKYDDGSRLELRTVHVTFYSAQGLKDGTLESREGTYNTRLSRLEARGNVVVNKVDGQHLETQQLVYDEARNQILSDSAFTMTKPDKSVLSGIGFESDPKFSVFRVLKGLKGVAPVQTPRQ